ncbi:MAG: hypothetical protein VX438_03360 [Planctomycetota bacterium]|nr:hypothetical protein [Planctomycetota bacterium]
MSTGSSFILPTGHFCYAAAVLEGEAEMENKSIVLTLLWGSLLWGSLLWGPRVASAQQRPRPSVQLPAFSFFRLGTTVYIPDRGEILLGAIQRSHSGSVSRGVPLLGSLPAVGRAFQNHARGRFSSSTTLSARVQTYDLSEMDRALLERARRDRVFETGGPAVIKGLAEQEALKQKAAFISRHLGRSPKN